jgi:Type I phosphodiesterase / nucleotide pyrophosphatase
MKDGLRAIVLEFNELTPRLMHQFMAQGCLPNFSRLYAESYAFTTDAGEDPPWLEPWIQWVTVHSGMPASDHGIFNLGDSSKLQRPAIWDVVSDAGQPVWICGSMNAFHKSTIKGAILPDPWSVNIRPSPAELDAYFDFVRSQVLDYTRTKDAYTLRSAFSFLSFMLRNGLKLSTIGSIGSQLIRERIAPVRWQRANILDKLQYDLFESKYRRLRPKLATFFLNSTAHFQHVYWRNMEPELFLDKPSTADQAAHAAAVQFGYENMDKIVGKVLRLAGDDTAVMFVSALSQQPCLKYEGIGGKRFHKPIDLAAMLAAIGLDVRNCEAEPVMSEQFHLRFRSPEDARAALEKLAAATVEGRPAFSSSLDGNSIMTGCGIIKELPPDAVLHCKDRDVPFNSIFYLVDLKKSGMHHRDGMAWIRLPSKIHEVNLSPVPLVDLAPTMLAVMGMPIPSTMPGQVLSIAEIANSGRSIKRVA